MSSAGSANKNVDCSLRSAGRHSRITTKSAHSLPGAPGPANRVARAEHLPPALAFAGPQLGAQDSAEKDTEDHPSHDHRALVIEPHEVGRTRPDHVAHWAVIAVDHPSLGRNRLIDAADEFRRIVSCQVASSRVPADCVEFDMRQLQQCRNSTRVVLPAPEVPTTTIRIRPPPGF